MFNTEYQNDLPNNDGILHFVSDLGDDDDFGNDHGDGQLTEEDMITNELESGFDDTDLGDGDDGDDYDDDDDDYIDELDLDDDFDDDQESNQGNYLNAFH